MSSNDIIILGLVVILLIIVISVAVYIFQENIFGQKYQEHKKKNVKDEDDDEDDEEDDDDDDDEDKAIEKEIIYYPMHAPRYYYKNREPSCTTAKYGVRRRKYYDYDPEDDVYGSCGKKFASPECRSRAKCVSGSRLKSGCGVKIDGDLYGCPSTCCKPNF